MKIQYCSDLHLEFPDNKYFIKNYPLIPTGEILLLAGDILPFSILEKPCDFIDFAADNFKAVYWIPGNHEYYQFDMAKKDFALNEKIRSNFFLVNNQQITYNDVNLIFSTLWSKISPAKELQIQNDVADFKYIQVNGEKLTPSHFSNLHRECFSFLESAIKNNDVNKTIVITHHAPTLMNYPPQYKSSPINEAFAVELFDFIENCNADYWLYGHHHVNIPEFTIGNTKMITNQLGYVKNDGQLYFKRDAFIEI